MSGGSSKAPEIEETAAERALAEVSARKWQDYQTHSVPLENQYMTEVNKLGTEQSQNAFGLRSEALMSQQTAGLQNQMNNQQFGMGIDPSSNRFKTKSMVLNNAIKQSQNNAFNQGKMAGQNAHIQGLSNVVAMGNNQEMSAFQGMGGLAQQAANQAAQDGQLQSQIANMNRQNNAQLGGQIAGAGVRYGMAGNNLTSGFNSGLVQSGLKYNTGFNSDQSRMLAQQESGFGIR